MYAYYAYSIFMSTVLVSRGLKFKINPRDHNPPHVHVEGYGATVRIDLRTFQPMDDTDFSRTDLKRIVEVIQAHAEELNAKWEEYHGKD